MALRGLDAHRNFTVSAVVALKSARMIVARADDSGGREQGSEDMMGWYGNGLGGAAPFMWVGMGLFWIVLIGFVVLLVVRLLPGGSGSQPAPEVQARAAADSAEQILDRMFATGEIDEETYRARRGALSEMRKKA